MRRHFTALACLTLAVLGVAAGLFAFPARADGTPTWSVDNLPAGYSVSRATGSAGCPLYDVKDDVTSVVLLTCNPDWQQRLDAFIEETICRVNPAAGQTVGMCLPETTTAAATVPVTTVETIPVADAVTTTVAPDATPPTVTVTVTDPTVDAKLTALQAQLDALSKRVDAVAQANTASWDAFIAATNGGASATDAALAARSAGLNALYQL